MAYFLNKESLHAAPINEINLSTVRGLSLLPYSNTPKKSRSGSARLSKVGASLTDMFGSPRNARATSLSQSKNNTHSMDSDEETTIKSDPSTPHRYSNSNPNHLNHLNYRMHSDYDHDSKQEDSYNVNNIYVDAPISSTNICSRQYSLELTTDKRSYWLNGRDINDLSEWTVHLHYAIFGKRIFHGHLTKKTKHKLQTKWKRRYIEVVESKIIRIYKDSEKKKVKQQIDIDTLSISTIKYGQQSQNEIHVDHRNIVEFYDSNSNLVHVFSADTEQSRDQFMDSLYITMNAHKIDVLCEGSLYFKMENTKQNGCISPIPWKQGYFALTEGSLLSFRDELSCEEFKHSIFSNEKHYNAALPKFVQKVIPLVDPQIERQETLDHKVHDDADDQQQTVSDIPNSVTSLKVFTITTTIGKCHFGVEDTTKFLLWCQSVHKYCKSTRSARNSLNSIMNPKGNRLNRNSKLFTDEKKAELRRLLSPSDDSLSSEVSPKMVRNAIPRNATLNPLGDNINLVAINDDKEHIIRNMRTNRNSIKHDRQITSSFGSNMDGNNGLSHLSDHFVMAVNVNSNAHSLPMMKPPPLTGSVSMRLSMLQLQDVISHSEGEESMDSVLATYPMKETMTDHEVYSGDSVHSTHSKPEEKSHSSMVILDDTLHSEYDEYEAGGYTTESTESSDDADRDCLEETVTEFERKHSEMSITGTETNFLYED